MTERIKGFTVALRHDIREDDAEGVLNAIRQLRGVADVTGVRANSDDWMNRTRIRQEITGKVMKALEDEQ